MGFQIPPKNKRQLSNRQHRQQQQPQYSSPSPSTSTINIKSQEVQQIGSLYQGYGTHYVDL
jgi:hypothetical protein